ncbi:S-layer homology domain-containing protein [Anaerosphaera multitolerans]|uniref:SLH domain-containing protein n=1 Tax=Anaerosphaera multitolerans TaxID=2487351 RepID=A0A437S620_9FIRM|nr:S-layer homology domain-containing protein [Anaerosphaera multitolerans]RVU54417.1 hypothetical protein EF514_07430 [Anaerosphaera multitolerans]
MSEAEYISSLENFEERSISPVICSYAPLFPWMDIDIRGNKVDVTISVISSYRGSDGKISEYRLVPVDPSRPIKYADAEGNLKDIEIIEEKPFSVEALSSVDFNSKWSPKKEDKYITKFKLGNIGFTPQSSGTWNYIALDNAQFISIETKDSVSIGETSYIAKDVVQFGFPDFKQMTFDSEYADFNVLRELLDIAEKMSKEDYTTESYNVLSETIKVSKQFLSENENNLKVEQSLIIKEVEKLQKAVDQLVLKEFELNKEPLNQALIAAKMIEKGNKTKKAFDKLKIAIEEGEKLFNSKVTQEILDKTTDKLKLAISEFINSPSENQGMDDPSGGAYKTDLQRTLENAKNAIIENWNPKVRQDLEMQIRYGESLLENSKASKELVNVQQKILETLMEAGKTGLVGTQGDALDLEDGRYEVQGVVFQDHVENYPSFEEACSNVYQSHRSMMDGAVKKPFAVYVENGEYFLELSMAPLHFLEEEGYLGRLRYESGNSFKDAEVLETYLVDEVGEKHGIESYPKVLRIPIEKPNSSDERQRQRVEVFVPVMEEIMEGGGIKKANFVIYWETLKVPLQNNNKQKLIDALHETVIANKEDANENSLKELAMALDCAKNVFNNVNVPDREVNIAVEELQKAVKGLSQSITPPYTKPLEKSIDFTILKNAIMRSEGFTTYDKTESSRKKFEEKLYLGRMLLDKKGATQDEINKAAELLYLAMANLEDKPSINNDSSGNLSHNSTGGEQTAYVEMWHYYEDGKYSMGNEALNHTARISEKNGQTMYRIDTHSLQFMGMQGYLTNLFIYDGNNRFEADKSGDTFAFTLPGKPRSEVKVAVWVDAMDEIAGGGRGSGEQNAILRFTYNGEKPKEKEKLKKLNTTRLKSIVNEAKKLDRKGYKEDEIRKLNNAIDKANRILNNPKDYDQRDVDIAIEDLEDTMRIFKDKNKEIDKNKASVTYEVPVKVKHAYDISKESMADNAIVHTAKVVEQDGKAIYTLTFNPMKLMGREGHLTNLFIYESGSGSSKIEASKNRNKFTFTRKELKEDEIRVAVWVDAMDEIAGGSPGDGEQDAILVFDWNNAKEVARTDEKKEEKVEGNKFTDIKGHWAENVINYVASKGYFKGTTDTLFSPDKAITRGQFVTVLGRMAGIANNTASSSFVDVKSGEYYAPFVNWADKKGIVKGYDDKTFKPNKAITREEMATILNRFIESTAKNKENVNEDISFSDSSEIAYWAREDVMKVARKGLVKGMPDGRFVPKDDFTRAQVAQVLYNLDH